jgi:hypothetical protein
LNPNDTETIMQETLFFFGHWLLLVEEVTTVMGGAQLLLSGTHASDGTYDYLRPGLQIDADGQRWGIKLKIQVDFEDRWQELKREYAFDSNEGLIAIVQAVSARDSLLPMHVRLRCKALDPDVHTGPSPMLYDFTIPERSARLPIADYRIAATSTDLAGY